MKKIMSFIVLIIAVTLSISCDLSDTMHSATTDHKMYVYSNTAQKFYLIDYRTFDVVKEIPLNITDGVSLYGMRLSTNRDYLFFRTYGPQNDSPVGFAIYNIKQEKFEETFFTELIHPGPVSFIAAQDVTEPGLIYAHLRDSGTFTINPLERRVTGKISNEYDFTLSKSFAHSPDGKWTVVHKQWSGTESFSELEFYTGNSDLQDLQFTLNKNDADSISIYDMAFSKDNEKLFISYQFSDGRSRDIESYFGSYDLENQQLYRSDLSFLWSLNPYYMVYNSKRNEIYTIGAYQDFHIIDAQTYKREVMLTLTEKEHTGPSRIRISPDQEFAFITSPADNLLQVFDSNARKLTTTIKLDEPYKMIIP